MKFELPQEWSDFLDSMPEFGMGYQKVDVTFDDESQAKNCTVINHYIIDLPEEGKVIKHIEIQKGEDETNS